MLGLIARQVVAAVLLAAVALALGWLATGGRQARRLELPWAIRAALGAALATHGFLLLGLAGVLRPRVVAVAVALTLATGAVVRWRCGRSGPARRWIVSPWWCGFAIAAVAPTLLLTLYPPLGFDQTMYHLPQASAFAATGGLPWLADLRFPAFPAAMEVLQAAVLLHADDVTTQVVGWVALLGVLALAATWARDLGGSPGARVAVAPLVGSPLVVYAAATGYVEPLLALFTLASLYSATRSRAICVRTSEDAPPDPAGRIRTLLLAALAGVFAGSAASVKYIGLLAIPAACFLLVDVRRRCDTRRSMVLCLAGALVTLAPTYLRLLLLTGNPVFPFFPAVFGETPWSSHDLLRPSGWEQPLGALTFLWDASLRRQRVGGMPFLSPTFAVLVPFAVYAAWHRPELRRLLVIAAAYLVLTPLDTHLFVGIAPLWAVIVGASAGWWADESPARRRAAAAAALLIAMGGTAYTVHRVQRLGLPPTNEQTRRDLLTSQLPLHGAVAAIKERDPHAVTYALAGERMVHYASGRWLGDHRGPASYAWFDARTRDLGRLSAVLDEVGATYLVLPAEAWRQRELAGRDPRLAAVHEDAGATVYQVLPAR